MELFKKPLEYVGIEKIADKRVSDSATSWSKDVLQYFYDSFPELMSANCRLSFKAKSPEKGTAVGAIYLNAQIAIPFIISDFSLSPLDVAITPDGKYIPFNRETIQTLLVNPTAFGQLRAMSHDDVLKRIFAGHFVGQEIIPDSQPYNIKFSSLEKVSEFVPPSVMKAYFVNEFKDPELNLAYTKNDFAVEALAKVADLSIEHTNEEALSKKSFEIDRDLYLLTKTGHFKWNLRLGSTEYDDFKDIPVNEENIEGLPLYRGHFEKLAEEIPNAAGVVVKFGEKYAYFNENGEFSTFFDNSVGINTKNLEKVVEKLASVPEAKDFGVFLINDQIVSNPFTIRGTLYNEGNLEINAEDGLSKKAFTVVRVANDNLWSDSARTDHYYVPGNAIFIKLSALKDWDKVANVIEHKKNESVTKLANDRYVVKGQNLEKYAKKHFNGVELNNQDTIWTLLQCGASNDDVEKVSALEIRERSNISANLTNPVSLDVLVKDIVEKNAKFKDINQFGQYNWTKMAAFAPDGTSADAVLSLNFLNSSTIKEFVNLVPNYEEVMSEMARLLIVIRLGFKQIPEQPVADAMNALAQVVSVLKGIRSTGGK